jgi:YD repeat-containing protein
VNGLRQEWDKMRIARRHLLSGLASAGLLSVSKSAFAQSAQTYTYDALGRLTKVEYADGSSVTYAYDAAGNRTSIVQTPTPPPGPFTATIPISSSGPVNLRTLANTAGYDGTKDAAILYTLASGVTLMGAANTNSGIGIDTGTWPGGFTIDLDLQISGNVYGGGGIGGIGAVIELLPSQPGGAGGDAIYCRVPIDVVVNTGGSIKSGGGGGGGGGGWYFPTEGDMVSGGGGGGGFPNGGGAANSGQSGTTSGGGAGGPVSPPTGRRGGAGGAGGGAAASGGGGTSAAGGGGAGWVTYGPASGGAAGFAIRKNGNTVNVTNNGTITGTAS